MVLAAGTKLGRYEIRSQIGEGGIEGRVPLLSLFERDTFPILLNSQIGVRPAICDSQCRAG